MDAAAQQGMEAVQQQSPSPPPLRTRKQRKSIRLALQAMLSDAPAEGRHVDYLSARMTYPEKSIRVALSRHPDLFARVRKNMWALRQTTTTGERKS
jgi:hypothetical protein